MITGRTQGVRFAEENLQSVLGVEDLRVASSTAEVPSAEELELAQLTCPAPTSSRKARRAQEIEVVADEPNDARREEIFQEICAYFVVCLSVFGLSHVVEECGCPHHRVVALASCELEDLKGVKKRVAFRMIARGLRDAIEGGQEVEELAVHST